MRHRLRVHPRSFLRMLGGAAVAKVISSRRIKREKELVEAEGYVYFTRHLNMGKPRSQAR